MLFLCLIVICLYLNEFTLAFTPKTVWGPSAVFTDSKIYITGGLHPKNPNNFDGLTFSNEFYYLDVKKPIVVKVGESLPWVELSSQGLPDHAWSAFSNCGLDDSLILYIGENDTFVANFVYIYGISSQQWNSIATTNPPLSNFHSQTQTVCDVKTRKMYRFGGILPSSPENKYNYNLDILDASTLVWEIVNAPEQRFDHTGTLLRSGNIVYIGGTIHDNGVNSLADMLKLPLYNTYDNKWTSMTTTGYSPARRACHSAVLTQDGRIIVYGGCDADIAAVNDDLVILDTSQTVYTWSKANVISATDPPLPRCYHTATLVGDHMIVLFGRDNTQLSNETFILDTSDKSNYKWVSEFDPNPKPSTQNKNVTIGIIVLSIVLALVGSSVLIYFYRKRKLSRPDKFVHVPQIN